MKYGSVCSGVEAATVAWHPLGWEPQWFSEIEKFPSAVLEHHYPDTPNLGDMTKFKEWPHDRSINLLVGGTPCQSFSVAGLRKGLDDPRGNLMLTYLAIAAQYQPKWLVWENVPGVLSSNRGRDFGTFLGALGKLGYGFAYRVLDAQYFGVAQRRRRVFVVGYLGDWRRAAAVLFERESMSGHPAPSRETREEVAKCLTSRVGSAYDMKQHHNPQPTDTVSLTAGNCNMVRGDTPLIAFPAEMSGTQAASTPEVSPTLSVGHTTAVAFDAYNQTTSDKAAALRAAAGGVYDNTVMTAVAIQAQALKEKQPKSQGFGVDDSGTSYTLTAGDRHAVAFAQNQAGELRESDVFNTLNTNSNVSGRNTPLLRTALQVRRLTPIECERLQGFPDNYTQIAWRNKAPDDCPDGPRYKAMGNSMAVPVMRWIGERIQMVEDMSQ